MTFEGFLGSATRRVASLILCFLSFTAYGQQLSPGDLQQLQEQLAEQQKTIQALQSALAEQQKKLDQMLALAAPVAPAPAAAKPETVALAVAQPSRVIPQAEPIKAIPAAPKWYEKYTIRGYAQFRNNRIVATNPSLTCEQCDRNIGDNTNFSFRRARMIFSGDVSNNIYLYFQTDFASTSGGLHFGQIRDLYADIFLDKKKEFRFRVGQSKVPFGFENLQSSQNRLALDRNDGLNSAVANERDKGVFFYYTPAHIRTRFTTLNATGPSGLKGSGDYGVLGIGIYNGQVANRPEANNNVHVVARATYPWQRKNGQYIEASIQGYTGRYTVSSDQRTATTRGPAGFAFADQRVAGTFVYYPQPWGFQTEFNVGKGPQFDPATRTIETRTLRGGYAQTMYMKKFERQVLTPYARVQYYSGGKKHELDARSYLVRAVEMGMEWQQSPFLEIVGQYGFEDRRYEDGARLNNRQKGQLLRVQLQINY